MRIIVQFLHGFSWKTRSMCFRLVWACKRNELNGPITHPTRKHFVPSEVILSPNATSRNRLPSKKALDIREYPLSRKAGFSKKAFAACLTESGITYEHCSPLGCPKPIRNQYKIDGDWSLYAPLYAYDFRAYIRTQTELLLSLTTEAGQPSNLQGVL